ncbi:TetR family transcriptional regulator [Nguyenibacter sp. L1]|uniref:TetR/AcrR family transcriptional regulator n=1 Tax=Nguyenibacter sp. L1 TaxID=3049350 RepID=UPI002B4A433F|nr:TetR family transcriptional regulator [Nguyenibacter sp. L1]WRH88826.1 TetR family transcriptional regulator [Nguyenibacter sp. L1]
MSRPIDPALRPRLLDKIIDYVRRNGVAEFSLRPLAASIGTSHRTILYHFESREQLLCTVFDTLREAGRREMDDCLARAAGPPRAVFRALWLWLARPEMRPTLCLFYEMYGIATRDPARFGDYPRRVAQFWLDGIGRRLRDEGIAPARADLLAGMIVAMFRGATLELAATGDAPRLTRTIEAFLDLLPFGEAAP